MTNKSIARFAGIAAGVAMAVGFAAPAGAQSVASLQAQIAALMAQLQALQGGASSSAAITSDLTVGSTGAQVVALQNALVSQGYLTMPAGVAMGFFGSLTKAAVMHWQAAVGLPSTGFFGPLSRAKFNGSMTTGGTTTGGTTTGGTTGTTAVSGTITTPGAEGTLSVTAAPVSNTTAYDSDVNDTILAFNAKATGSDIAVQRVKLDLGATTNTYNKVISNVSLWDDQGHLLAQSDTNSSTVVKDSDNRYYLTLTGFSSVVPKGSQRVYTVKANIRDNADSDATNANAVVVRLAASGVRAIDGAGIDLYSPTNATDVSFTFSVSASLADSASLTVSTDAATPLAQEVVANNGASSNQIDKLPLLTFDIKADKDDVTITDLYIQASSTQNNTSGATASSTYLTDTAGNVLASASAGALTPAHFNNLSIVIPKGTTKTFMFEADIRSANATQATFAASLSGNSTNVVGTNTAGDTVTNVSGAATGNSIYVRNTGPVFSLVGAPTITKGSIVQGQNSTSTATATFNLNIKAVGSDVTFGTNASSTSVTTGGGPLASNGTGAPARSFIIYLAGAANNPNVASSTDYAVPSSGVVTTGLTNSFTVQSGNSVTLPINFTFQGGLNNASCTSTCQVTYGSYAVGLERLNWVTQAIGPAASTFMSGRTEWRTPSVTMP